MATELDAAEAMEEELVDIARAGQVESKTVETSATGVRPTM